MARVRAAASRRETRRRRSVAMVAQLVQQLSAPAPALSHEEALALHARLSRPPEDRQAALPLGMPASSS